MDPRQQQRVLIELRLTSEQAEDIEAHIATSLAPLGFQLDPTYKPIPISSNSPQVHIIVRGSIAMHRIPYLENLSDVVTVYQDAPIEPFTPNNGSL